MATVVCIWEQGSNLGHLGNLRQVALRSIERGHQVWVLAKDLENVHRLFSDLPVHIMQSPVKRTAGDDGKRILQSFSQLIRHSCYRDRKDLKTYVQAWRSVFEVLKPDIVFYDHSPLALVASWGLTFTKVLLGSGFTLPPTETPLFGVFPTVSNTQQQLIKNRQQEQTLLEDIASVYNELDLSGFNQVADIYRQADHVIRLTIPEFDHFGPRPVGGYVGVWPSFGGAELCWSGVKKYKVFAYLQPFVQLPVLLDQLVEANAEVVIYSPSLKQKDRQRLASSLVKFSDDPLDLQSVAGQVDFAITHGNHDTSTQLSLAGTPLLLIPRHQEQQLFSLRLQRLGVGVSSFQDQASYASEINELLNNSSYRENAVALQKKYDASVEAGAGDIINNLLDELQV